MSRRAPAGQAALLVDDAPVALETKKPRRASVEQPATVALVRADETGAQMFERLAKDQTVDISKLQQLIDMHERAMQRVAEDSFNSAMAVAQKRMRPIATDMENKQTQSKYASYAKLDRALRPIYTDCGFSLSFNQGESPRENWVRVLCYATHGAGSHGAGFTRMYHLDMPADGKGAKGGDVMTLTHAVGAAMSYAMRYLLKMIFNVAVGEEDRDGNVEPDPQRPPEPPGLQEYWNKLVKASENGESALEAVWACSQNEPYKTFRKFIADHSAADWQALKVKAKKVGR